jgi:hypothetical protein
VKKSVDKNVNGETFITALGNAHTSWLNFLSRYAEGALKASIILETVIDGLHEV